MSDDAKKLADALHAKQKEMNPKTVTFGNRTPDDLAAIPPRSDVMDEQFPTNGLNAEEEMDEMQEAKLRLQPDPVGKPGMTRFGKLTYSDADAEWALRKAKAVEYANFQKWFAENFDKMSPSEKRWARETFPEFYAEREQLLRKQAENLIKVAKLKQQGVTTYEDLMTLYMLETGRLDVGNLEHLLNPESAPDAQYAQRNFKRGLLSPFRVFGEEASNQSGAERMRQQKAFAQRKYDPNASSGLGLVTGFPPMPKKGAFETDQGAKEWFDVLAGVGQ